MYADRGKDSSEAIADIVRKYDYEGLEQFILEAAISEGVGYDEALDAMNLIMSTVYETESGGAPYIDFVNKYYAKSCRKP